MTGAGLPWHTLPRVTAAEDAEPDGPPLPELMPSAVARIAETPFEELDARELAVLGRWLEGASHRWPTRRSRRAKAGSSGHRLAMRETMAASRRTGWEPMKLKRYDQVRRPLTVTLFCDVSQSMQGYATAYLHLMRVFARTRHAETFAFSTSSDPAHPGAGAAVAVRGGRAGGLAGGGPVRRHPPRPLPGRAAPVAARQRRARGSAWSSPPTAGTATRPRSWPP